MSTQPQVKYARTSDGVNIAWFAIGEGLPFVFPFTPPSHMLYQWEIPELRRGLEEFPTRGSMLVSHEARGSGLSDHGPMDLSCEALVRDFEAVVEAAAVERFVLLTFAYMTMLALAYAALHPERVLALVLLDGVISGTDMSESWKRLVRIAREDWEDAKVLLARTRGGGWQSTVVSLDQSQQALDHSTTQEEFLAFCEAMATWDVSDQLARVTAPALVLHQANQRHVPLEASRRLAASLPSGTFGTLEPGQSGGAAVRRFLRSALPQEVSRRTRASRGSGTAVQTGLTVILFADIADSTAHTERLGDDAFRTKARELDGVLRAAIREHSGTPIEGRLLGDGVLAVFTSARQGIEAALACGRSGEEAGLLHLGLHAGDVTREEDPDGATSTAAPSTSPPASPRCRRRARFWSRRPSATSRVPPRASRSRSAAAAV